MPTPTPHVVPPISESDRALARMFGFRDEPTEAELVAADLAYNASKATFHQRNDAAALSHQIMLGVLLREVA